MGVLYHRRTPGDHLRELASFLVPGGQLVLETLIVPGETPHVLRPPDRYARMRNVWYLPSAAALVTELARAGFADVKIVDITRTTTSEQRSTAWMTFESLDKCLDPDDADKTIEGHPAPTRLIAIARAP